MPKMDQKGFGLENRSWLHIIGIVTVLISGYLYSLCLYGKEVLPVISTIVIIMANLYVAKLLEKCTVLAKWGRYTMWCCGNEYIIRHLFNKVCDISSWISNSVVLELLCWGISIVFLLIVIYIVYPLENRFLMLIKGKVNKYAG